MDVEFFNVENVREFTSIFLAIYSTTSKTFKLIYIIKLPPIDIIELIVNKWINQDKKVA